MTHAARRTASRKEDHVRIVLEEDVTSGIGCGFERYRFQHRALPEIDLDEVSTGTSFLGRRLVMPILIGPLTGGAPGVERIVANLAEAAQATGVGLCVGSQRAMLEDERLAKSYGVRAIARDVPLLANLGAVQLNYGYGVDACRRAVDSIGADALVLHLNALQEALQPEGDVRWSGVRSRIEAVARAIDVPVVVKEVGWGISAEVARELFEAGVTIVDVAGAGGTSFSEVEKHRALTERQRAVAAAFVGWGIPTAECLVAARAAIPTATIIASGGLSDGIHVAKALALGADLATLARVLLRPAAISAAAAADEIETIGAVLRTAMFAIGARDLASLRGTSALVALP